MASLIMHVRCTKSSTIYVYFFLENREVSVKSQSLKENEPNIDVCPETTGLLILKERSHDCSIPGHNVPGLDKGSYIEADT